MIAFARTSTPCHGPNVPTKPTRVSSGVDPKLAPRRIAADSRLEFVDIDAVWIDDDLFRLDAGFQKVLALNFRDDEDSRGGRQIQRSYRANRSSLSTRSQCRPTQTSDPLYSRNSGRFVRRAAATPAQLNRA